MPIVEHSVASHLIDGARPSCGVVISRARRKVCVGVAVGESRRLVNEGGGAVDRKTVACEGVPDGVHRTRGEVGGHGGRAFLDSWRWGAILVAACVVGVVAIVNAHPFASASVSERVSAKLGRASACTEVGAARVAGVHSTIYRCTVGMTSQGSTQCFAVSGRDVKQLIGSRDLGC
jgi:hypothetical protein